MIYGNKIRKLFKAKFLIEVKIVYTTCKVRNYFSLKCRTPLPLLANVVYKFQCLCDANLSYLGKTKRHLVTRVREHGTAAGPSAIKNHLSSCTTCHKNYSVDACFTVIETAKNDFHCSIKEAIQIKSAKPLLNTQLASHGMSFFLNIF